ncbi:hypothetical protein AVEN_90930-1, partial [Araneus ventricosus]
HGVEKKLLVANDLGGSYSIRRTTGFAPNDVITDLEPLIFEKVYGYKTEIRYTFTVGDPVRISKAKTTYRRGYLPNWSDEVFTIDKRFATNPPTYILKDLRGETLKGRLFYANELVSKTGPLF